MVISGVSLSKAYYSTTLLRRGEGITASRGNGGLRNVFGNMMPTVEWDPKKEVLIEPLTNFKIIKDLAVDPRPFWAKLEKVKPWILESSPNAGEMPTDKAKDLGRAANCFLCALYVGSCLVNAQYSEYLCPLALAQVWRYVEELTDPLATCRLGMLNSKPEGALGCEYCSQLRQSLPSLCGPR